MIAKILFSLAVLCGTQAWADAILTLEAPRQNAHPGDTIMFRGFIGNTDPAHAILDLNSINITLSGMFLVDTSSFFDVSAPLSVGPSPASTVIYSWFTLTVLNPYTVGYGVVSGQVSILGGAEGPGGYDPTVQDLLGSTGFVVNVTPATAGVPEPSTWVLLLTGGGALLLRRFRGRGFVGGASRRAASQACS